MSTTDGQATGRRSAPARARTWLAILFSILLGIVLGEVALRAYGQFGGLQGRRLAARDPLSAVYEPYGESGYRAAPGKVERFPNGTAAHYNAMAYRGPVVRPGKPSGVYRIVLLGGSTAVGYGVNDDQTIDAFMRRMLHEQRPDACFEVVNLALGGYDSYQDYERMRVDGTRLEPDLVIVHSGINDVRNAQFAELSEPPDPKTLIWEGPLQAMREAAESGPSLGSLVKHYSFLARLPGFVMDLGRKRQNLQVIRVVEPHDAAVQYYETNLARTVELGLNAGAAVLLSKPPSALTMRNQPTDPVEKSYWIKDAGTTEAYRDRLGRTMAELVERYRQAGAPVAFVAETLPLQQYLDDAHLNAAGNATVAQALIAAAAPFLPDSAPTGPPPQCEQE